MTTPLIIIAPHPDDELLGAGAIMARAVADDAPVAVIILTDGGASDPTIESSLLSSRRRGEVCAGLEVMLGNVPPIVFLDQLDGKADARSPLIGPGSDIAALLAAFPDSDVLVTDPADGHPDHKAAFGLASRFAAAGLIRSLSVMPVSQRIDGAFDPMHFEPHPVDAFGPEKAAALACHQSQIGSERGFALSSVVIADFCQTEYTSRVHDRAHAANEPVAADHFEGMFRKSPDPWGYDTETYEADRFARTIAALGGKRFEHALELGCGNGALTSRLVDHCDAIVATDVSHAALEVAATRLAGHASVMLIQGQLPQDVPHGTFDLIVMSDMLYYLGLLGVARLMSKLQDRAAPNCQMVITNYLGETECVLSGEMAAEIALAHLPGWTKIMAERTDRLRIDVLDRK